MLPSELRSIQDQQTLSSVVNSSSISPNQHPTSVRSKPTMAEQDCVARYDKDVKDLQVIGLSRPTQGLQKRFIAVGGKSDFAILSLNRSEEAAEDVLQSTAAVDPNDGISIQLKKKLGSNSRRKADQVEIIQWNPTAQSENLLLTSAMNQNPKIYLYDIDSANSKPILEFKGHTNKTRVSWNPFKPSEFISGSFDRNIFMWDLRQRGERTLTFLPQGVKIKHVAYDPHNEYKFAAGDADGSVKIWDYRNPSQLFDVFQAQTPAQGELTYLDWHPTVPYKMLTAGSDCNIYCYNLQHKNEQKKPIFHVSLADHIAKTRWIPGLDYQFSSIMLPKSAVTYLQNWHAMKVNVPQSLLEYANQPIQDFEWLDSSHVVLTLNHSVVIKHLVQAYNRPYAKIVTTGLDFSPLDQLAFVNDQLVPTDLEHNIYPHQSRDPDLFLASLERQAKNADILMKAEALSGSPSGPSQHLANSSSRSSKNKTGIMAIGSLDRDLKELSSTKGSNFAHLIHRYSYRKDQLPDKVLKKLKNKKSKDKSAEYILCRLNERACKKAGIEEVALTWKSMATLYLEFDQAKQQLASISNKAVNQAKSTTAEQKEQSQHQQRFASL